MNPRVCISEYFARAQRAPGNRITAPETSPLFFPLPYYTTFVAFRKPGETTREEREKEKKKILQVCSKLSKFAS